MRRFIVLALTAVALAGLASAAPEVAVRQEAAAAPGQAVRYRTPPQAVVDILEAEPLPQIDVSPDGRTLALFRRRSMPPIAELAEPMLRLAGHRINPTTSGPHRLPGIVGLAFKPIDGGPERVVALPAGARLLRIGFSPDGRRLAFGLVRPTGIELWVADPATGQARALTGPTLNATFGTPCEWLDSGAELVCAFVPERRGPPPAPPAVPLGPNVQEHSGKPAPAPTYQDLLETEHDARLFEHYFTSQLAFVDAASGRRTPIGRPGLHESFSPSPDGRFLLIERLKRPFSYLVPSSRFAKDVEIWSRAGERVRAIADLPLAETVPINGVPTGPRAYRWQPAEPATVVWVEALDEGDPRKQVPHRDRLLALRAPFGGEPTELLRTEFRFQTIRWTERGAALVTEFDRPTRRTRTWVVDAPGAAPRKLWDRSAEDRYGDPGTPVVREGRATILQHGDWIYTTGPGATPEGERPFLARVNLKTGASEELFRSPADAYESVEAVLADDGRRILTRRETRTEPPNIYVRDLGAGERRAITAFADPHPAITAAAANRRFVTYRRKDGVQLSGTIYTPPGWTPAAGPLPMLMWAYPREFTTTQAASQVVGSPNRFTLVSGASHLLLLTQGYAIFDGPTMPIVGKGETANDTYVEQLVASAEAAVEKAVELGVADRARIGVGGHSYGAFMTANLLAHSDLFRAGIARSGAYNRTLTPFGFQNERRTFWEAREVYTRMSPFFYADRVNEPILLIHGEADDNSGTHPIQSERFFMALKGHGATVRYVTLPLEAHGYVARESVLHTVAEMLDWMERWVKRAGPRETTAATK
ncbi:MAG TPA: prolyl oligopeptidase family serine peptidase [Vicinamibacterales bacterium]|nr:prolyl oligopeptidase family serine peptidase [Vicinamibacterales bacterium]